MQEPIHMHCMWWLNSLNNLPSTENAHLGNSTSMETAIQHAELAPHINRRWNQSSNEFLKHENDTVLGEDPSMTHILEWDYSTQKILKYKFGLTLRLAGETNKIHIRNWSRGHVRLVTDATYHIMWQATMCAKGGEGTERSNTFKNDDVSMCLR